jgi:osmotically-inducible protein OsmY
MGRSGAVRRGKLEQSAASPIGARPRGASAAHPARAIPSNESGTQESRHTMKRTIIRIAAASAIALTLGACASTATTSGTGEWFDDSWITTKVKTQLIGEGTGFEVGVETFRGTVQLSGFAKTQADIDKAVKIARETQGVKGVKNDIRLRAGN